MAKIIRPAALHIMNTPRLMALAAQCIGNTYTRPAAKREMLEVLQMNLCERYTPEGHRYTLAAIGDAMCTLHTVPASNLSTQHDLLASFGTPDEEIKPSTLRITPDMLNTASYEADLNAALFPLQDAAGITTGDAAGVYFSGPRGAEWPNADTVRRRELLAGYLEFEQGFIEQNAFDDMTASIMALKLFNPISGHDVETEDVCSYADDCRNAGNVPMSVAGFKTWLETEQ